MSNAETVARLIDTQQDCICRLEELKNKIGKENKTRRTRDRCIIWLNDATSLYTKICENHKTIGNAATEIYLENFPKAQVFFEIIKEKIRKSHPDLVPPADPNAEARDDSDDEQDDVKNPDTTTASTSGTATTSESPAGTTSSSIMSQTAPTTITTTENIVSTSFDWNEDSNPGNVSIGNQPAATGTSAVMQGGFLQPVSTFHAPPIMSTSIYNAPHSSAYQHQYGSFLPQMPASQQMPIHQQQNTGQFFALENSGHPGIAVSGAPQFMFQPAPGMPFQPWFPPASVPQQQQFSAQGGGCLPGSNQYPNFQPQQHPEGSIMDMLARTQLTMAENMAKAGRHARVPESSVMTFGGDPKMFETFKSSFITYANSSGFTQIQLLNVLLSKLEGEALICVAQLHRSAENYNQAWTILEQRFNNRRVLLLALVNDLVNAPQCRHMDHSSLVRFINCFQNAYANLEKANCMYDELVIALVLNSLDNALLMRLRDALGDATTLPTIEAFTKFLISELSNAAAHTPSRHQSNKRSNPPTERDVSASRSKKSGSSKSKNSTIGFSTETGEKSSDIKKRQCFLCKEEHKTTECATFLESNDREKLLRHYKLCIYCVLHKFNYKQPCRKREYLKCDKCGDQHITLMHPMEKVKTEVAFTAVTENESSITAATSSETTNPSTGDVQIVQNCGDWPAAAMLIPDDDAITDDDYNYHIPVLPTLIVNIMDNSGCAVPIRCMLDECSYRSYITEDVVQKLKLQKKKTDVILRGINGISGRAKHTAKITILLEDKDLQSISSHALVVPSVTGSLPLRDFSINRKKMNKKWADPTFFKKGRIQALIGSDIAKYIMLTGIGMEELSKDLLLKPTRFGWIVTGTHRSKALRENATSIHVTISENIFAALHNSELAAASQHSISEPVDDNDEDVVYTFASFGFDESYDSAVSANAEFEACEDEHIDNDFAALEKQKADKRDEDVSQRILDFFDVPAQDSTSDEIDDDEYCRKLFMEQHQRDTDGRYRVPIPWRRNPPVLGSSYRQAVRFFRGQELRWLRDPKHHSMSNAFMLEYASLGHMIPVAPGLQRDDSNKVNYIPYISVFREDAVTTKVRNVFNASAKTSNGVTLNDTICPGPKLPKTTLRFPLRMN